MCVLAIKKSVVYLTNARKGETPSHLLSVLSLLSTVNQDKPQRFSSPMTACFSLSISLVALYLQCLDEHGAIAVYKECRYVICFDSISYQFRT